MHFAALLLMSSTAMQMPATAAPPIWGGPGGGAPETILDPRVEVRASTSNAVLERTERTIDAARRDGSLSREDARAFRREVRRMRAASERWTTGSGGGSLTTLALALEGQVNARRALRRPD